ncbi:MAG: hypothetical protein V5B60_11690 [Accumulibacter sp.]|jgi:hypothetical protein
MRVHHHVAACSASNARTISAAVSSVLRLAPSESMPPGEKTRSTTKPLM